MSDIEAVVTAMDNIRSIASRPLPSQVGEAQCLQLAQDMSEVWRQAMLCTFACARLAAPSRAGRTVIHGDVFIKRGHDHPEWV